MTESEAVITKQKEQRNKSCTESMEAARALLTASPFLLVTSSDETSVSVHEPSITMEGRRP